MKMRTRTIQSCLIIVMSLFLVTSSLAATKGSAKLDPAKKAPASTVASKKKAATTTQTASAININTADLKTLEKLPGVGAATARDIVAARPFKTVDDLQKVKGIGKAKYDALKGKVTVEDAASAKAAPDAKASATDAGSDKKGMTPTPAAGRESAGKKTAALININMADQKTLETLPEIGPVKAKAIMDHRPYAKIEDIMNVPGIKQATFAKIKDKIAVK